jgi:hypothetical protein
MLPALRHSLLALAAGIILAIGVWFALPDSGPPPSTFALYESNGAQLMAEPGAGFYGVERNSKHRWSWTGGEATLVLHRLAIVSPTQSVRLRFTLQSIVPRNVTVRYGEFILWKGRLDKPKVAVDIPSFTLTGPSAEIVLSSDLPGDLKPGGGDPRKLAFALYDLEISPVE